MLAKLVEELCAELGYPDGDEMVPGERSRLIGWGGMLGRLSNEDERLAVAIRRGLAKVAAALNAARPDGSNEIGVGAALDGAELVTRGELARGNGEQVLELMPSFVFLVALPIVEHDEALDLSNRTAELIEGGRS